MEMDTRAGTGSSAVTLGARRRAVGAVVAVALLSGWATIPLGVAADATESTPKKWQPLPGVAAIFSEGTVAFGWASNRAWVATTDANGVAVTSLRPSGGDVREVRTTRVAAELQTRLFVGGEFVYSAAPSGAGSVLQSRQLLANGTLGPSGPASVDPGQIAPQHHLTPDAAIRLGDRTLWSLPGSTRGFNPKGVLWVCCAEDGTAQDLTGLTDRASQPRPVRLGLDGRGRLWLAWRDREGVKLVELDPATLAPGTRRNLEAPSRGSERFELVCAAVCRVVIQDYSGIHSWAPGERSVTRIAKPPSPDASLPLVAAAERSGRLVVAYQDWDKRSGAPRLAVLRGDARGAAAKLVGSITGYTVGPSTHAMFVPDGLLVVTPAKPNAYRSPVLADVLPLSR
jgi:hypothetical protein